MTRQILVFADKDFRITIPDDATLTFGPWSPPTKDSRFNGEESRRGTLRIYEGNSKTKILGVFSGVKSFRDMSVVEYEEKIAVEEGATMWKSDQNGYRREEKVQRQEHWASEADGILETGIISDEEF